MTPDYYHARARLARALLNVAEHLERNGIGRATKSTGKIVRSFQDVLTNALRGAFNGRMSARELTTAIDEAIQEHAPEVYREGMREGGSDDPEADQTDKDTAAIDGFITSQRGFIPDFAQAAVDVATAEDKGSARASILARAGLWVSSMSSLGDAGNLSVQGNISLTFTGDDGEENCETCASLKGKRHKKSWWEKRGYLGRPNENYVCGRYNCQHYFVDDEGNKVSD